MTESYPVTCRNSKCIHETATEPGSQVCFMKQREKHKPPEREWESDSKQTESQYPNVKGPDCSLLFGSFSAKLEEETVWSGIEITNVIKWGWAAATAQWIVGLLPVEDKQIGGSLSDADWWSKLSRQYGHWGNCLHLLCVQLFPSPPIKCQAWMTQTQHL